MEFNPDTFRNILQYISDNLELRHNGSVRPLYPKRFDETDPLLSGLPDEELYYYVDQLLDAGLIKVSNDRTASPRGYSIVGITHTGNEFLSVCVNGDKWKAAKKFAFDAAASGTGSLLVRLLLGGML